MEDAHPNPRQWATVWMHRLIQPANFGSCWCGLSEWSCRAGLHSRGVVGLQEHFATTSIQKHFPSTLSSGKRSLRQMVEGSVHVLGAKKFAELEFPQVTRALLLKLRCYSQWRRTATDVLATMMSEFELFAEAISECLGIEAGKRARLLAYTDAALHLSGDPHRPDSKELFRALQGNTLRAMLQLNMDDEALKLWGKALEDKDRGCELQSLFWTKARLTKHIPAKESGKLALEAAFSSVATRLAPRLNELTIVIEECCSAASTPWHSVAALMVLSCEFRHHFPLQRLCMRFLSELIERCSSPESLGPDIRRASSRFRSWVSLWLSVQVPQIFVAGAGILELRALLPQRTPHLQLPGMQVSSGALNLESQLDACAYCIERDPMQSDGWCLLSQALCDLSGNQRCGIHLKVAKVWTASRCLQWSRLFLRAPSPPLLSILPDSAAPALLLLVAHLPKATFSDVTALAERWLEGRPGQVELDEKPGFLQEVRLQSNVSKLLTERSLRPEQATAVGDGHHFEAVFSPPSLFSGTVQRHQQPHQSQYLTGAASGSKRRQQQQQRPQGFCFSSTGLDGEDSCRDDNDGDDDDEEEGHSDDADDDDHDEHDQSIPIFG